MASIASLVKDLRERTGAGMLDCKKALEASENNIEKAIDWLRENGIAKAAKKGDRVAAEGLTKVLINGNDAIILELNAETDFVAKNDQFLELLDKIANGLLNSAAKSLEEGLKVEVDGETIEDLVVNGTATIGEKISLRRFAKLSKTDSEYFEAYSHMGGRISTIVKFEKENKDLGKNIAMHIAAEKPEYLKKEDVNAEVVEKERKILLTEAMNEGKPENIAEKITEGRIRKFYEQICLEEQSFVMDSDKKVKEVVSEAENKILDFVRYEVGEGIEKQEMNFAEEVAAQAKL